MSNKIHKTNIIEIKARVASIIKSDKNIDIAEALFVEPNTCSNWNSRNAIPWENLYKFCQKREVSFDWLLTGKEADVGENIEPYKKQNKDESDTKTLEAYVKMTNMLAEKEEKIKELENTIKKLKQPSKDEKRAVGFTPNTDTIWIPYTVVLKNHTSIICVEKNGDVKSIKLGSSYSNFKKNDIYNKNIKNFIKKRQLPKFLQMISHTSRTGSVSYEVFPELLKGSPGLEHVRIMKDSDNNILIYLSKEDPRSMRK